VTQFDRSGGTDWRRVVGSSLESDLQRHESNEARGSVDQSAIKAYLDQLFREIDALPTVASEQPDHLNRIYVSPTFSVMIDTVSEELKAHLIDGGLEEKFVPSGKNQTHIWSGEVVMQKLTGAARFVVRGHPGQGKSVFLKRACHVVSTAGRIPVFIELRRLNRDRLTLMELIIDTMQSAIEGFNGEESLFHLARANQLVFMFDGLDEIADSTLRSNVALEISRSFVGTLYKTPVIVTTRFEQSELLRNFETLHFRPFEVEKAAEIAARISGDDADFLKKFTDTYYPALPNIFSIPLFIQILYATEKAALPYSNLGEFLKMALDHLTQRHDLLKKDKFERFKYPNFSAVSHRTFMGFLCAAIKTAPTTSFSETDIEALIADARDQTNALSDTSRVPAKIEASDSAILKVLIDAIGLMVWSKGYCEFKHPIFVDYYFSDYILYFLSQLDDEDRGGAIALMRGGWTYRVLESLSASRLAGELVHPVTSAIRARFEVLNGVKDRLLLAVDTLVVDRIAETVSLQSDGGGNLHDAVWSLIPNCLNGSNRIILAKPEEFDDMVKRVEATAGPLPDEGISVIALSALPDEFFEDHRLVNALEDIVTSLRTIESNALGIMGTKPGFPRRFKI